MKVIYVRELGSGGKVSTRLRLSRFSYDLRLFAEQFDIDIFIMKKSFLKKIFFNQTLSTRAPQWRKFVCENPSANFFLCSTDLETEAKS